MPNREDLTSNFLFSWLALLASQEYKQTPKKIITEILERFLLSI